MNPQVKIEFIKKDPDLNILKKAAYKLVSFIKNNQEYLDYFADILLEFSSYSKERMKKMEEKFKIIKKKLTNEKEMDLEKFNDFKMLIKNYYRMIDVPGFYDGISEEIKKYDRSKFLTPTDCLNIMRGKIFEILIEDMVRKRYKTPDFSCGCMIILNGNELKTDKRKTVDVAGWSGDFGEFYECKVSPDSLDEDTYQYIYSLETNFLIENINYRLGCVTLDTHEKLMAKSKLLERKLGIKGQTIKMIGREKLEYIRNFEIQNEAS